VDSVKFRNAHGEGNTVIDLHIGSLISYLKLLDSELIKINAAIRESKDPESDGLLDNGEYIIGNGLVAIQHYLKSVHCLSRVKAGVAFNTPPYVKDDITFVSALNAGANYWKHQEEWYETLWTGQDASLKGNALKTLATLEKITPWEFYTCANLLAILVDGKELELSSLLPKITEWGDNLGKIR
jgi:hypothetical protein